jgi:hypothetical protein
MSKLHSAGLSLAARGLLFVSRNVQEGSSCAANHPHEAQQAVLFIIINSSCRVLHATLAELAPRGREEALAHLQEQGKSLLDRITAGGGQEQGTVGASAQQQVQVLTEVASDLEQFAVGMAAQLPASYSCNYPGESSRSDVKLEGLSVMVA